MNEIDQVINNLLEREDPFMSMDFGDIPEPEPEYIPPSTPIQPAHIYRAKMFKHQFRAIAAIFAEAVNDAQGQEDTLFALRDLARELADYLQTQNRMFRRHQFLDACGVPTEWA